MNEETGFLASVLRDLATSTAVILAAWGALGGATNALTTRMRLRDAVRHILLGGIIAAGMGSLSMSLVGSWLGLPAEAIPAGGAAGSAAYLVGVFGPAFIEMMLERLRGAKGDGDEWTRTRHPLRCLGSTRGLWSSPAHRPDRGRSHPRLLTARITTMKLTDRGLLTLIRHEGIVPAPYLDVAGVWTFGIGHTATAGDPKPSAMKRGMPDDLDAAIREAFRVFRADIARYERDVCNAVAVPMEAHQFDALVSFHYNTGAIHAARLTRLLNAGRDDEAAEAFMGWLKPSAIRPRRDAERDLFRHGRYPDGAIPVWPVDAGGRVDFAEPARRLSEDEALALLLPVPATAGWLARLITFLSTLIGRQSA